MEKLTHAIRDTNLGLQLIYESPIKNETVMSWSSQKKKECIFCSVYFASRKFLNFIITMYSVLNKISEYVYFYESKTFTRFFVDFKIVESLRYFLDSSTYLNLF